MYNNPYMPYNNQSALDRINSQMAELEKMKEQLQKPIQQPSINQTFQLASSPNSNMKYANNIEDVNKELVFNDTPYFSKDMSVVWIKNAKGEIKTYELNEIISKDNKDIQIEYLQAQIEELKKEMKKYESTNVIDKSITESTQDEESTNVSAVSKPSKKQK